MKEKESKEVDKKVDNNIELSQTQFEILQGLANYLTITEIAKYRKCSRQAIYKTIFRLLEKGFIEKIGYAYGLTEKGRGGLHQFIGFTGNIRLHNFAIKVSVLESPTNWDLKRNKIVLLNCFNKQVQLKNNEYELSSISNIKIKTTPKSVIFYLPSTYGKTVESALEQAMSLFFETIPKVESLFKIKLIKERKINIQIISQHYARLNDALAKLYKNENQKLYFIGEDGKVWLIADYSFSTSELEAIHTIKAPEDMTTVANFMNDLRKNPTTTTQILEMIRDVTANQVIFDKNMQSHIKAVQDLGVGVRQLTKAVKKIQEENIKLKLGNQRTLSDF